MKWPIKIRWIALAALLLGWIAFGKLAMPQDSKTESIMQWERLAPVPEKRGLAAAFAGVHGTTLLLGGGANFPERFPWEGGQKVWHDGVWALEQPAGTWHEVGRLPRALGYGVSISTAQGVVCIGGSDVDRHYADVFLLSLSNGKLVTKKLPALPSPIANACGAIVGETIYLAGGIESPQATTALNTFLALDLSAPQTQWKKLDPWPGPARMLAVAATLEDSFFLISGADLTADAANKPVRKYLTDAYRFHSRTGWQRIAELPHAVVAAPSPAPRISHSEILVIGGDDGSKIGFQPPEKHPGFPTRLLAYDARLNKWRDKGTTPAPRVTVPVVKWGEQWLLVSGEERPGVRSPEVWSLQLSRK